MSTLIFQAAKLGDPSYILEEILHAREILKQSVQVKRVFGVSGGALTALAFTLTYSAHTDPDHWGAAATALDDFYSFLQDAKSRQIRSVNPNPWYGIYNLQPLQNWLHNQLRYYAQAAVSTHQALPKFSDLRLPLYQCAIDHDGTFSFFGQPDPDLTFQYHAVQIGPPKDAEILDATIAALSTMLSTVPVCIGDEWYRDCRPAIVNSAAIVADLLKDDHLKILRSQPHAPIRPWKPNWITSSFIMHSQNERNQSLLAEYYLDLKARKHALTQELDQLRGEYRYNQPSDHDPENHPVLRHIDLPYIGSTEARTNMHQSVQNKTALMNQFQEILAGQLDGFPFHKPANIIYGAGGFSGILAGLVTTRAVDSGFENQPGDIRQIYGSSAGVLNGFFHAVQIAARKNTSLYTPAARNALADLETFIAHITPDQIARINLNPLNFWQGWANLEPLKQFLSSKLAEYTGSSHPEDLTFDDIQLPLTIVTARLDGFCDFLGMSDLGRRYWFAGKEWEVKPARVIQAILAGWSMNTYIQPTQIGDQSYTDGAGAFYDPGLFVACFDPHLTNLLNVHLDEPEGHSYNLPPKPDLMKIIFDTHNYVFPEERRRMRAICDLLYEYYGIFQEYLHLTNKLSPEQRKPYPEMTDFRQEWHLPPNSKRFLS